jgi:hypothetical protein
VFAFGVVSVKIISITMDQILGSIKSVKNR